MFRLIAVNADGIGLHVYESHSAESVGADIDDGGACAEVARLHGAQTIVEFRIVPEVPVAAIPKPRDTTACDPAEYAALVARARAMIAPAPPASDPPATA